MNSPMKPESGLALIGRSVPGLAIGPEQVIQWREKTQAFHRLYKQTRDQPRRFECVLDFLYGICRDGNRHLNPETRVEEQFFSAKGNLDTGNAIALPFPPAVVAMCEALGTKEEYAQYLGPRPVDDVHQVVKTFLTERDIVDVEHVEQLDVAVGCGTVHLYDAVVRHLVRRRGDVIFATMPTYGFFLPQPHRLGGRFCTLKCKAGGQEPLTGVELAGAILRTNTQLRGQWEKNLEAHLRVFLSEVRSNPEERDSFLPIFYTLKRGLETIPMGAPATEVDVLLRKILLVQVFDGDESASSSAWHDRSCHLISPPRVVGFLHVNPDVRGVLYRPEALFELATVLREHNVPCIEDLAFHHLTAEAPNAIRSMHNYYEHVYMLLGVSKPLAIANLRAGVLVTSLARAWPILRLIENSIGYVSSFVQEAVRAALAPEHGVELTTYFARNAKEYRRRRRLMLCTLQGIVSVCGDEAECVEFTRKVQDAVHNLFARKHAVDAIVSHRDFIADFLQNGLQRWLRVVTGGDAGFFVLVDCAPLIAARDTLSLPELDSATSVAALFYEFFGVRVIPQEAMGMEDTDHQALLRLSFSTDERIIIQSLFTIFLGIEQLSVTAEAQKAHSLRPGAQVDKHP